jgi:hypothetical protein
MGAAFPVVLPTRTLLLLFKLKAAWNRSHRLSYETSIDQDLFRQWCQDGVCWIDEPGTDDGDDNSPSATSADFCNTSATAEGCGRTGGCCSKTWRYCCRTGRCRSSCGRTADEGPGQPTTRGWTCPGTGPAVMPAVRTMSGMSGNGPLNGRSGSMRRPGRFAGDFTKRRPEGTVPQPLRSMANRGDECLTIQWTGVGAGV